MQEREFFPDGTAIDSWFYDYSVPKLEDLGKQYKLTDYGILDDGCVHTDKIQALIDEAQKNGGGVIVVPKGVYCTGAIFFKQGVNLYVEEGGVLKGSDDISDYPVIETRMEGETCKYFPGLVNADNIDGFVMCGKGTIDGNGLRSWKAFWQRRAWNRACTNKDEQRPRLLYISNCKNVIIADLKLQNSHYWTTHIYKCQFVKYINCDIFSPVYPIKAPSTDAIDIDVCSDVLIKNCHIEVNDDGVALKGGKGPWADTDPKNGINERIIIEDCKYGFCHGCLTFGSESVHDRNIIMRRIEVDGGFNNLNFKMRPDTPQVYEHILIEDVHGHADHFFSANPWRQFYDLKDRKDIPLSYGRNLTMRNCEFECDVFFDVQDEKTQYILSDFKFENLKIKAKESRLDEKIVDGFVINNVDVKEI